MWIKRENMIVKMTNKNEKFYQYMGKFFGSRLVEKKTSDRIYDDDNKVWYVYFEEDKPKAFASVYNNVIKNVYGVNEKYLAEVLKQVKKENKIKYSVVTNTYTELYKECGFHVHQNDGHKNFVMIYMVK